MKPMIDASQLAKGPYVLTKFSLLSQVVTECPKAAELLAEYGLHCANCFLNDADTLEKAADIHGMSQEEVDSMIDEINQEIEKKWKEDNKNN